MTRTARLLDLLQVLRQSRMPVTATELARKFNVSERTVYRDIQTLVTQGATVLGEAGIGYVLKRDYFLPPLAFDQEEAAAILLGLRFVLRRGDSTQIAAAQSARGKLAAVTPQGFSMIDEISAPLLVAPSRSSRVESLLVVRDALKRERKLVIEYLDVSGRQTQRTTWPVAIGWFDECEMLAAWCESRSDFRHFRIDRLVSAQALEERPPVPRSRLLAQYRAKEPGIAF